MKVFVKTFGCALNKRDSENIEGILKEQGFELTEEKKADIIIVNTCGVKSRTQNRVISYINQHKKPVYVGGCLPKMIDLKELTPKVKGFFDTNTITKIASQIKDNLLENFSTQKENRLNIPLVRSSKDIAIIPISQGCLGNCAYCSVKFARGSLKSYTEEEILKEIEQVKDYKIIHLTSQDCGCYGKDINTNIISLLKKIISLGGNFKVKMGMANPEHVLPILNELIEVYKSDRIIKILHIPVQSGSNKVLKEMKRKYTVEQFKKIVKTFRKEIPEIHILTDIILGYPTESKLDFQATLNLIKEIKPEVLNTSKFAPRPKTEAAKLKQLKSEVIKQRSIIIHNTYQ
ncbi:MAG: tRNA (N(6)-L-threonylcarbamoyladenosine(37)-C(2))-methylthiotransferase [archaeon]